MAGALKPYNRQKKLFELSVLTGCGDIKTLGMNAFIVFYFYFGLFSTLIKRRIFKVKIIPVCFRPGMKTGSSVVLIGLAVADTLFLFVSLTALYLEIFGIFLDSVNNFTCKSYLFVQGTLDYIAVYYLVVFTIFRVISVHLPHKNNVYCTRKRAFTALIVTFIVMCLLNLRDLYVQLCSYYDENFNIIGNDCCFRGNWANYNEYYRGPIELCLNSILPFSVLIIGNLLIIYKIRKFDTKRQEMTQTANHSADDSQSMTAMLISISVLFLVTQTPFLITNLIERRMNYDDITPEYEAGYSLLETFTELLKYINNVANFLCYCISGKRFKSELVSMVKGWLRVKDSPAARNFSIQPQSSV